MWTTLVLELHHIFNSHTQCYLLFYEAKYSLFNAQLQLFDLNFTIYNTNKHSHKCNINQSFFIFFICVVCSPIL